MTLKTNSTVCTASKILKVLNHSGIKCVEIYPAVLNLQNIIRVFNGMGMTQQKRQSHLNIYCWRN